VGDLLAQAATNNVDEGETAAARKWFAEVEGARAALREAMDAKNVAAIDAATPKLAAILPQDPMITESKQIVKAVRGLLDNVNAAVKALNVAAITLALDKAKAAGFPDALLADATAWKARLTDLEDFITDALEGNDLAEIGAAVKAATKLNYTSDNVELAKAMEARLKREAEVCSLLDAAVRSRKAADLNSSLEAAAICEKNAPSGKITPELAALIVEAKRILKFVGEQSQLASELINALEFKQYAEVKRLVGRAAELKLDENELKKAQKWLQEVDVSKGLVEQAISLNDLKA
jgi:hypothetical protein